MCTTGGSSTDIVKGEVLEDTAGTVLMYVVGNAATAITQASLTSITCKVFDVDGATPDTPTVTPTVTISSSVYDTLQTDARWTTDTTGYNFAHTLTASVFTTGDHTYVAEYTFTPTSGEVFKRIAQIYCKPIRGS